MTWAIMEDDSVTEIKHLSIIYIPLFFLEIENPLLTPAATIITHCNHWILEKLHLLKSLYLITEKSDKTDMKY